MSILQLKRDNFITDLARECEYSLGRAAEAGDLKVAFPLNPWMRRAQDASRMAFALIAQPVKGN